MPLLTDILGMVGGELWAGEKDAEATRLEQEALQAALGLTAPELERLRAEQLGPSAMEGVKADPQALQAQRQALADMQRMSRDGGGVEMRAAGNMAQMQAQQAARAQQQAALASLQSRGMGGGGQALAARLLSGSNAANMQAQAGTDAAMDARRQALAAMQGGAGLASTMRGQSAQMDTNRASAADAINRFNSNNRSDANRYNAGLGQQNFQNQARVTGMANDARMGAAGRARDDAYRRRSIAQGAGDSAGNALSAADEAAKKMMMGGF